MGSQMNMSAPVATEMKQHGNENFQRREYDEALESYRYASLVCPPKGYSTIIPAPVPIAELRLPPWDLMKMEE